MTIEKDAHNEKISLSQILDFAIDTNASDIHLSNGLYPFFRVYGSLEQVDVFPKLDDLNMEYILDEILTQEEHKRFNEEKNIDSSYSYKTTRLRVHGYFQRGKKSLSLRLIPTKIPVLEDLHLPPSVKEFTRLKNGLILVTGITGSGKSTTLAAMINDINTNLNKRILTIEDPIEYMHVNKKSMIEQREVGNDVASFNDATKASLRADPDIILVGEIRDLDTISNAITLAETGHLVFATLHTRSAAESPDRLVDVFPAAQQDQIRMQLGNNLSGIISQQLIPSKNGKMVPLVEVLKSNTAVKASIKDGNGTSAIKDQMQMGAKEGMVTRPKCGLTLIEQGLANEKDVLDALTEDERKELETMIEMRYKK